MRATGLVRNVTLLAGVRARGAASRYTSMPAWGRVCVLGRSAGQGGAETGGGAGFRV